MPTVRRYAAKEFALRPFDRVTADSLAMHAGLYQGYVAQTNGILDEMGRAAEQGGWPADATRPAESIAKRLSFELNGVVLHELFFEQLVPAPGAASGSFERAACHNFGSVERWKDEVRALARTRGSGWVMTALDGARDYLHNLWIGSHDMHVPAGHHVVFLLDLWEHAYLADYGAKGREPWVEAVLQATATACLDQRIDRARR